MTSIAVIRVQRILQITCLLFCATVLSFATGCQTLSLSQESSIPPIAADADAPMYKIQMAPTFGKSTVSTEVISENMTVQDAIEKAGAPSKFRNMEITLSRLMKGRYEALRMPIEYQVGKKSVLPAHNYALHPGDTISIRPKQSSTVDKLIGALTAGAITNN